MDKKSILGFVVMGAILFGWAFYSSKQNEKRLEAEKERIEHQRLVREEAEREQAVRDSLYRIEHPEVNTMSEEEALSQRIQQEEQEREALQVSNLGRTLVEAQKASDTTYILENEVLRMFISAKGGQVSNVELKNYTRYGGGPLMLYKNGSANFDMELYLKRTYNYAQVNTSQFVFDDVQIRDVAAEDGKVSQQMSLRLPVDGEAGAYVEYIYTLKPDEYMVDFQVKFIGMEESTSNLTDLRFNWGATTLQNEKGFKNENNYTTIAYRFPNNRTIEQLGASEGSRATKETTRLNWISFKQQFFSSIFIASGESFSQGEFGFNPAPFQGSGEMKAFSAALSVPYNARQSEYDFQFYFGPNQYQELRQYDLRLEKVIPLGGSLISWINTGFVIPVFNWMSDFIGSFGIIILLLTLMIKIIILPLTYKSYMSSAKMRTLKPELEEINQRYPKQEDAMKKQQATMALYKQSGVSPMGGCLPMLIQMPILIAMFRFFPSSIELRGESFLWAEDLSAYDSIYDLPFNIPMYGDHISLFTLLMAAALFLYSRLNYEQTAATGGQQMAGMKFMTVYLMPVMMLLWFNSYASGLTYYYLLSQLMTIAIMTGFRYFVNDDKLRAKMQANASKTSAKPKKKSKFMQRYEDALRQQQQTQRQQQGGGTASGRAHTTKPQSTKNQPKKKKR